MTEQLSLSDPSTYGSLMTDKVVSQTTEAKINLLIHSTRASGQLFQKRKVILKSHILH